MKEKLEVGVIFLNRSTRKRLKSFKQKGESYNNLLIRWMDEKDKPKC